MRHRLVLHGMFPPELPNVTMRGSRHRYFEHQRHSKALEVRHSLRVSVVSAYTAHLTEDLMLQTSQIASRNLI